MASFLRDVWFGARLLGRSPIFTFTGVLLLAVGISANTLIFSVVDVLMLRPLAVPHPENLVRLIEVHPTGFVTWEFPYGLYEALAANRGAVSEVLADGDADVALTERGSTERIRIHFVSPNLFASLGARAYIGRVLTPEDDRSGSTNAVLSYDFWDRRFQRDRSILSRSVTLQGVPFTIVGVLPHGFNGLTVDTGSDIRVPASADRLIGGNWGGLDTYGRKLNVQIVQRSRSCERLRPQTSKPVVFARVRTRHA